MPDSEALALPRCMARRGAAWDSCAAPRAPDLLLPRAEWAVGARAPADILKGAIGGHPDFSRAFLGSMLGASLARGAPPRKPRSRGAGARPERASARQLPPARCEAGGAP
eukprot:8708204-Pyramimonas_sp.AAC.1